MHTKINTLICRRNLQLVAFATMCIVGSFLIGIQSAGDVKPVLHTEAQQANLLQQLPLDGDIDGDGKVTLQDEMNILQMIQGTRKITEQALATDPDHNGQLTVSDAIVILDRLATP